MFLKSVCHHAALAAVALTPLLAHAGILEDRAIEDAIESSYVFKTVLTDRSMIQIYVRHGEVEVRGQAADERERALLEYTLAAIPDVTRVDSHLFVDSSRRRESFRWRAARLLAVLRTEAGLDASRVQLEAHEGSLDLIGTTPDQNQRERIESRLRQLAPNDRLTNRLEVESAPAKPRALDDASITAMVRCALEALPTNPDAAVRITSRDGEVVIEGSAASPAEIEAMTRRAESIRGVRLVRNRVPLRS
jgi:osmotically-inducible protein OsmY